MSFCEHLLDAIRLNRARRPIYARQSRGRSWLLSNVLLGLEWATLPVAWAFERRATTATRKELLDRAFVPVHGAPAPDALRRGGPSRRQSRAARRVLRQVDPARCHPALRALEDLEDEHDAALAMSRHLVESIARTAHQAELLGLQDDAFARDLVRLQLAGLPLGVPLDRLAQRLHRRGVRILVDDLPSIPLTG